MDVWAWVRDLQRELAEHGRLPDARTIDALPGTALSGDLDRADALATELVALSRALEVPWLELYARHWRLQACNADQQGTVALREVTELFERASHEEMRRCPQSVCVTQDLCLVYGNTDGPGFAAERVAVATETMAGIDPTWPCWACLTCELVDGHVDAGDLDAADRALDEAWAAQVAIGERPVLSMEKARVERLLARGRWADALARSEELAAAHHPGWDVDRKLASLDLYRAEALAHLGRADEAVRVLPAFEHVERLALPRQRWVAVVEELVAIGPRPNTAELGAQVHAIVEHLRARGAWRHTFTTAAVEARLAVGRRAGWVAAGAREVMVQARAELRTDAGADAELAAVDAAIASLASVDLDPPVPADALSSYLQALEDHDLETEVEWLRRASIERPDDDDLVGLRVALLGACGREDLARAVLDEALGRLPGSELLAGMAGEAALRGGDDDAIEAVAARVEPFHPTTATWIRARGHAAAGRWAEAADAAGALAAVEPDAFNARRLWAAALRRLGRHEDAVAVLTDVIDRAPPERASPGDHWERLVDATVVGRWDVVHASVRALGMTPATASGPIDEDWGPIALAFEDVYLDDPAAGRPSGAEVLLATRTGPVTARVRGITATDEPQRVGDLVVFDAAPLNAPPDDADDEARATFIRRYAAVGTLVPGGYTGWVIDGVDPGEDRYWPWRAAVEDAGLRVWIYSDEGYRVVAPDGTDLPGLYGRVATPAGMPLADADAVLRATTAGWPHPLTWLDLATAAGADPEPHRRAIADYGL